MNAIISTNLIVLHRGGMGGLEEFKKQRFTRHISQQIKYLVVFATT